MSASRRWTVAASVVFALACVAGMIILATRPPAYSAQAIISVSPREKKVVPSASMIQLLATKYVSYAASASTLTRVADETGMDPDALRRGAEATMPQGTTTVYVRVTTEDGPTSLRAADALSEEITTWSDRDPTLMAETVVDAELPQQWLTPRILAIWLALGVALICSVVLIALQLLFGRARGGR